MSMSGVWLFCMSGAWLFLYVGGVAPTYWDVAISYVGGVASPVCRGRGPDLLGGGGFSDGGGVAGRGNLGGCRVIAAISRMGKRCS